MHFWLQCGLEVNDTVLNIKRHSSNEPLKTTLIWHHNNISNMQRADQGPIVPGPV